MPTPRQYGCQFIVILMFGHNDAIYFPIRSHLTVRMFDRSIIELCKIYSSANFNIMDTLEKPVLLLDVMSIIFRNDQAFQH